MPKKKQEIYVLDTSVVIEKKASELINKGRIKGTILISHMVVAELENQANKGLEIGYLGLEEIQTLQDLSKKRKIKLQFVGERPTLEQIKLAKKGGAIDASIRAIAFEKKATLITADKVQSQSAKAFGINVIFIEAKKPVKRVGFLKYFDKNTMSVHIKENEQVYAKRGKPGEWNLVQVTKKKLAPDKVQELAKEIVEKSRSEFGSFVEIERRGSTIIQYQKYRIVIVKPPVSNGWEITIVSPIKRMKISDYKLPEKILTRLKIESRGMLVAGETGSGKSTLVQAIAEMYTKQGRIVKTVESPRDLSIKGFVTQYSKNFATGEEIHDLLFLSRPDQIIFDEIRDTPDFELYSDLKLAGSNCLGVIHASKPIDAIQRFVKRIDIGMIPSVVDTILFVSGGQIESIFVLDGKVKVPTGMVEEDLARPVVDVRDFLTEKLKYEIYSYGEQTVVMPVDDEEKKSKVVSLAEESIEKILTKRYGPVQVKFVGRNTAEVYVRSEDIPLIIGKRGQNIDRLEGEFGVKLNVKEMEGSMSKNLISVPYKFRKQGRRVYLSVDKQLKGRNAEIWIDDEFLMDVIVGKKGEIKMTSTNPSVRRALKAIDTGSRVEVRV